jgi:hypothetical protein
MFDMHASISEHLIGNELTGDPVLQQLLEDFCIEKLVQRIEFQSLTRPLPRAQDTLELVHSSIKVSVRLRCEIVC